MDAGTRSDQVLTPAASPSPVLAPAPDDPLPGNRFIDRELSWLRFNQRVLELAENPDLPVLERARFLSIFATNLDEFFMVRVASLKRRMATGIAVTTASGLTPREQLEAIWGRSQELMARHAACFSTQVLPALRAEGIEVVRWSELTPSERTEMHALFRKRVYPVLTPLAVDPGHPFPYISGLSLNLAVMVRDPMAGTEHFARVKVPGSLARFIAVGPQRFVPLEDVIAAHLSQLFPGLDVVQSHSFRVTRNEDLEVDDDEVDDLLEALERELQRRRFGPPVRLEVESSITPEVLDLIVRELGISDQEVFTLPGPLDLSGLAHIADLDRDSLKYPRFVPRTHPRLAAAEQSKSGREFFAAIRRRDILVHHPYDSFRTSVQALVEWAAADPSVQAIKQTLYRTSGDSPIVDALIDAAEQGKQVLVLVEIKARFDEQANIRWARKLEQAGCHVVYGVLGLKTHCKLCMVVRDEPDGLRRYVHVGTGNYNPKTARLYEDLGLLTADPAVGADVSTLFNRLSAFSRATDYQTLLVAPNNIRRGLIARIDRAAEAVRAGRKAKITIKVNSLVDEATIDALYRASQSGVPVDIAVRGICALRPGVPGMSENIRVRSVLGRFLEHSRIFRFTVEDDDEFWIGSADLMHRNLDRRVEALIRVTDQQARAELAEICEFFMSDEVTSWRLAPDGSWTRAYAPGMVDYQTEMLARKLRNRGRS